MLYCTVRFISLVHLNWTMDSFDIDLEILYSIKRGENNFEKIWNNVNGTKGNKILGSRTTLSKYLSQLVEGQIIYKNNEDGNPYYELGELSPVLESGNDIVNRIKDEISTIVKKSIKIRGKRLLQTFVTDTKDNLAYQSSLRFENLMFQSLFYVKNENQYIPLITMNERQIEMIDKLIKKRIEILLKKDDELYEMFCHLISYNLEKEYN